MIKSGQNFQFAFLLFIFIVLYYLMYLGSKGRKFHMRRLPVLDSMEEAVGRSAEMGRPIMFNIGAYPGAHTAAEAVASYAYLGHIAKMSARYGTVMYATCFNIYVQAIMESIVRDAYSSEGKQEDFRPENIQYLSDQAAAWGASVQGIMSREQVATHFYFYPAAAVSCSVLEYANSLGILQISGTTLMWRLSDTAVTADYLLIGEELYVGTAYLTGDMAEIGLITGEDIIKWISVALLLIGTIAWAAGSDAIIRLINL